MPLSAGTRLGPYEVLALIGAGGMGEVYRARDTRLDRTVAIKVLPAHVADRPELRQRFEREARAVSSLNHPHICTLHDVGQQDGIDFLVMEYVEGETLARHLAGGPLPMDQALRHAIEIADALAHAHRHGVCHRDLKPGNIMLTKAGAKLLDFGLAKLRHSVTGGSLSQLPTEVENLTQKGSILGTIQYMPPEQLEGKETDATGDIFSFGAVLYEMVTGRKAFPGSSQASVIAAIMSGQPTPMATLEPVTPEALEILVQGCLAKDPEERWQNAHDLAGQLKWIAQSGSTSAPAAASSAILAPRRERLAWGAAALLLVCAVALAAVHFREAPPKPRPVRFQVLPPEKVTFDFPDLPIVSPDGERLAITGTAGDGERRLWIRSLDSLATQALSGTEGAVFPFWSPDSRFIAFFAKGKLKKVEASGGPVQELAEAHGGGTWNRDGVILFSPHSGEPLYRVAASGGDVKPATSLDSSQQEANHICPYFLPDGRHFLYSALGMSPDRSVRIGSLDSKQVKRLALSAGNVAYAPGVGSGQGHLLFLRSGALMAQPFDAGKLELSGEPVPIVQQIALAYTNYVPGAAFSVSENGVLAYRTGGVAKTQLTWFDRAGKRLGSIGQAADYSNPALSPDGKKVAVGVRDPQTRTRDIWVIDLTRGASLRLTFDPADETNAVWSPDGLRIAFASDRKGRRDLYQKLASGTGADEVLLESDRAKNMEDWSPDGRFILYNTAGQSTGEDVWAVPVAGDRKPIPVIQDPGGQGEPQISPNGRWIAYRSTESGRNEVFVQNFPPSGGKWQISTAGGTEPKWRRDGKELFYIADTKLMAVDVKTDSSVFEAGVPKPLFEARLPPTIPRSRFEVTGDGQRFLVNTPVEETEASPITVVLNWTAALKR